LRLPHLHVETAHEREQQRKLNGKGRAERRETLPRPGRMEAAGGHFSPRRA
jgi:hypothetical protein